MKINRLFLTLLITLSFFTFSKAEQIIVVAKNESLSAAAIDLKDYLSKTYPDKRFVLQNNVQPGTKNIVLETIKDARFNNDEAFVIDGNSQNLRISGKTTDAVVKGIWSLLKKIGWSFYLSFEIPPEHPKPLDFSEIKLQNAPLKAKRIIFNWHNFMSGCTGWDLQQWQKWIDNSSKIGFNTIMVHAYGNNPMQSFSLNGEKKELGYLTTSQKGRDWGAQHVNDVRLMVGGNQFSDFEFGANAAKVSENDRSKAATKLMQQVFQHAARKSMDVCFAIDVDTWMANPQNVINTLPDDALIEIGGYKTANPEHPEGRKFYEAQLKQLFADYPEINMLAAWMRMPRKNPGQGSIWLLHDSSTLPEKWRKEYFQILKQHPELKDEQPYPGIFAISKIIKACRDILDEIKPDVELVLGSWRLDYPKQADSFMPDYCGFIPLDWEVIFDKPEVLEELAEVGQHRKLYPVVWAHHDDHRYIGRPYQPFSDFNSKLNKVNAEGYGIIHWTTHPLDLYFTNTENQVWENTENELMQTTIDEFVESLLKTKDENLLNYYRKWFKTAPMFGRETTDYFIRPDEKYNLDGYDSSAEVVKKSKQRLELLLRVDKNSLNEQGMKEFEYQRGMENFIVSFFENHQNIFQVTQYLDGGETKKALPLIRNLNAEETIGIYARAISDYGATRGEEGILLSLNLRWLPDYIDVKQRAGVEPVRINFQPTSHDSLAQGAGHHTYFIDNEKKYWLGMGEKETGIKSNSNGTVPLEDVSDSWIEISEPAEIKLKTMRGFDLPAKSHELKLVSAEPASTFEVELLENAKSTTSFSINIQNDEIKSEFDSEGGEITLRIIPDKHPVKLAGVVID